MTAGELDQRQGIAPPPRQVVMPPSTVSVWPVT